MLVIGSASVAYLRSTVTSKPRTPAAALPIDPLLVTNNPVSYDFITPSIGWASSIVVGPSSGIGQILVFKTVDGAKHWEEQPLAGATRFPGFVPLSVQFFGKTQGFLSVGMPLELYRTTDGGAHWAAVSLPPSPRIDKIAFSDASHGWLLAADFSTPIQIFSLYATSDAGDSWHRLPDPPIDAERLGLRRTTEAWMGSFGPGPPHLYTSGDAGQTWHRHDLPAPVGESWDSAVGSSQPFSSPTRFRVIDDLLPGAGVVATVFCECAHSDPFYLTSSDGGVTWRYIPSPPGLLTYQDSIHWWATSDRALFKSSDAGPPWRQVATLPQGWQFSVPGILDSNHAWSSLFLVGGYGLALTNDGGLHWTLANVPQPT